MKPDLRCYYHPEREATSQCDRCGDYLCDVCAYIHHDQHLCRTCWAEVAPSQRDAKHLKLLSLFLYIYDVLAAIWAIIQALKWVYQYDLFDSSRGFSRMAFTVIFGSSLVSVLLYRLFLVVGSIIAGRSIARRASSSFTTR